MLNSTPVAESLFYEATRDLTKGNGSLAETKLRQALSINPNFAEAHANLAYLMEQNHRQEEAELHYLSALQLNPDHPLILLNFGAMLAAEKRWEEAEALYRKALDVDQSLYQAWSNLGVLLACIKREQEAECCYRVALTINPDYRKAQFNLAYLLLRQGRFEEGWQRLEARDWYERLDQLLVCPRWNGEPLTGKTILIGLEAGHGDMIQFSRYALLLKETGALRVSILSHPSLVKLLKRLSGIDEVISVAEAIPTGKWDFWVAPLSLPGKFKTSLDTIPAHIPYLRAESQRVAYWAKQIGNQTNLLRVGLVWKGNPLFENDADRSLPSLRVLHPLWDVKGVSFYSLQKEASEHEISNMSSEFPLTPLGHLLEDFSDTAAVLENLDLVITVDTAVAHLAGSLGKPCWVLLPDFKTDWRWLVERSDSPWYPNTMTLFRQAVSGDWTSTISAAKRALLALTKAYPSKQKN